LPLYAYRCTKCGHSFEKIQSFSDEPETVCPKCGGALVRPLTAPAFQFKGSGWYVNDYASKSPAPKSETSSTEAKPAGSDAAPAETKKPAASEGASSAPAASSGAPAKSESSS